MNNDRLCLYTDSIYTYLEHEDKIKFRQIAYNNKMTISEFNRKIILLVIKLYETNKLNNDLKSNEIKLLDIINSLGGIIN